jgi:anti-anti-sigma factor
VLRNGGDDLHLRNVPRAHGVARAAQVANPEAGQIGRGLAPSRWRDHGERVYDAVVGTKTPAAASLWTLATLLSKESEVTAMVQAPPESVVGADATPPLLILSIDTTLDACVVHVAGELDLATRDQLVSASTTGHHRRTTIDLGRVTFMDCGGYTSLTMSRRIMEGRGGTLVIAGQTGQPARLLDVIAALDAVFADAPADTSAGSAALGTSE